MYSSERSRSFVYRRQIKSFLLLYFLQGMPYGLQTRFLPLYLRVEGMSLSNVGLYKLLLIPWILKGLWAPLMDRYGSRKTWLSGSLFSLVIVCMLAAHNPPSHVKVLATVLFLFNLLTSLQDTALDALVIEILQPEQLMTGNVAQVVGYKAGSVFSGGILACMIGTITWEQTFYLLAAMYAAGFLVSEFYVPYWSRRSALTIALERSYLHIPGFEDPNSMPHVPENSNRCGLYVIFQVRGTLWMFFFVLMYKIGEQGVMNMFPLFLLDHGVDAKTVGFWTGFVAQSSSLIGATVPAVLQTGSLLRALREQIALRTTAVVALSLLVMDWKTSTDIKYALSLIVIVAIFFASGTITTCTFTLIMLLSRNAPTRCRISHYTLLATAEVLGKLTISSAAGALTQYTSYQFVFGLFAVFSVLSYIIVSNAPQTLDTDLEE